MRLSIDVGGTFTDLVLVDDASGSMLIDKLPSTPASGQAVVNGIARITKRAGINASDLDILFHGFTIATNAWLTRSGARVVLLVSEGYADILAIGSQRRPHTYDLAGTKPQPLVPRSHVVAVHERIDAFGNVVVALEDEVITAVLDAVAELKPQAVAVSLLFSWVNEAHEQRLAAALTERLPGIPVYRSSRVNPQIQEYPRANTTAAAAYVGPPVRDYTESLEASLSAAGVDAPLRYMRSDGGAATAASARANPASMLLSGPAGGVVAALALGEQIGVSDLVTFDMGGTSADFSVVRAGQAALVRDREFDGLPLRVPMLEIKAISAGGGSIAWVDRGGALQVGPASAGAQPGPACYGLGGVEPTLTDAALALGLLDAEWFAGGELTLDPTLARAAIDERVAGPLGLSIENAALGMLDVATASMAQAIRELSTERGDDLAQFSLLSFGGAGGLFAPYLLADLGLRSVLVPRHPGVFAALGLHYADLRHHAQAPFPTTLDRLDPPRLRTVLDELSAGLHDALDRDRVAPEARRLSFSADMRYVGQHHELEVEIASAGHLDDDTRATIASAFHRLHEQRYGYCHPTSPVELTNLNAIGVGLQSKPPAPTSEARGDREPSALATRCLPLGVNAQRIETRIYNRDDLHCGHRLNGPAIVVQHDATTLILAGQAARVDSLGFIHVSSSANED